MNDYQKLTVWKVSKELTLKVYKLSEAFPDTERFGLTSQIRRSVISVPSNIAEGAGRNSKKDFNRFIAIALGSLFELETQLIIAHELGYTEELNFKELMDEITYIKKMLYKLTKSLEGGK
jgi:four helix bundle protein